MKSVYIVLILFLSSSAVNLKDLTIEHEAELSAKNHIVSTADPVLISKTCPEDNLIENWLKPPPAVLTRGPYLQVGTQTSIIIRWRTDIAENSRVQWGTIFGTYPNIVDSASSTTEHIVQISGLNPDTKYWYTIGSSTLVLQATNTNYFLTLPPSNTTRKLRFVAFGDCGNNSANQVNVKNTLINYVGSNDIDAMLLLGDNAYASGTDVEYQNNFSIFIKTIF